MTKLIVNEKLIGSYASFVDLSEALNKTLASEHLGGAEHHMNYFGDNEVVVCTKFFVLQKAVKELYYAGKWHYDLSDELSELWENVIDAAGFTPGESPRL